MTAGPASGTEVGGAGWEAASKAFDAAIVGARVALNILQDIRNSSVEMDGVTGGGETNRANIKNTRTTTHTTDGLIAKYEYLLKNKRLRNQPGETTARHIRDEFG